MKRKSLWTWYDNLDTKLRANERWSDCYEASGLRQAIQNCSRKIRTKRRAVIHDVAKELGISGTTLRRWINEYDEYGESAFPGHGNALFNSTYEIKKLQKQIDELKLENELLKKFQAFLKRKNV